MIPLIQIVASVSPRLSRYRQAHSVRGFLSGTVRKKLGLALTSQVGKDGVRRYSVPGQG